MTLSRSPQCRAFSRALVDEKSLSPQFPVVGGGSGYKCIMNQSFVTTAPPPPTTCTGNSKDSDFPSFKVLLLRVIALLFIIVTFIGGIFA